jgi:hypothetical protein
MPSVFVLDWSAWPKSPIERPPPRRSLEKAAKKHETTKQRLYLQRLEGGTLSESPPVASPTSPTSPTPPAWWGSSPPLDYGFVAVAWSLSCTMTSRCHMSCQTWLWPYYVILVWWILILLDDLWDVKLYHILNVWVNSYCYPIIITCSNQTCCESMCGGWCVLDGVTW